MRSAGNLKPTFKIILLCLGMSMLSICMVNLLHRYVLVHLGNLTLDFFQKYLIIHFTTTDNVILNFFPVITGLIFLLLGKNKKSMAVLMLILQMFLTIYLAIIAGIFIALITWNQTNPNPFLPDYVKYQPFPYYWTIFILLGSFIPMVFNRFRKKGQLQNDEIIDGK